VRPDRAASTLIVRARPWSGTPVEGADAVALGGGRVLAVGPAERLEPLVGRDARRIDAGGATVTPGLVDAHIHLLAWARSRREAALSPEWSRDRVLEAMRAWSAAHPAATAWVGRGWAADGWDAAPTRAALDTVARDRPVLLHSKDFHALWVNTAALRAAGVDRHTPDPPGGLLERDAAGEPTGVAREHAVRLFRPLMPEPGAEADRAALAGAVAALHAAGITGVHVFEGAAERAGLRTLPPLRVLSLLAHAELDDAIRAGARSGASESGVRLGPVKLFADGTLGSRTAAMLEPYDGTGERGLDLIPPAELRAIVARALAAGIAVAVHAIGDRAVRSVLDAFESAAASRAVPALPSRIEHAQLVDAADVGRFGALGVAASMQPAHCTADIDLARRYWSTRLDLAYPWRSLLDAGARLAFGSDAPVEPPDPGEGLASATARRRRGGQPGEGFGDRQRITLDEALAAYTEGPARLAGSWPDHGRLAPGAVADLVVWSADLHALDADALRGARPRLTLVGGDVVYGEGLASAHRDRAPTATGSPEPRGGRARGENGWS
jgi:predicted amidohydrolase YtcJ